MVKQGFSFLLSWDMTLLFSVLYVLFYCSIGSNSRTMELNTSAGGEKDVTKKNKCQRQYFLVTGAYIDQ